MESQLPPDAYLSQTAATRPERMRWWHDARFGMFVHWGLYSQLGRHEWVMNRERIPMADYEKLADSWHPRTDNPARDWARLAKQAGMQYMVLTTKHHEGFCLWATQQTSYNAVQRGPGRDLVREYVEACREFGLKVGFYYSLMDWHHPDGALCATDEAARRRFLDFTQGCVRELCTQYGQIDILWYDVSWPLETPERWEALEMNQLARQLQPGIIINRGGRGQDPLPGHLSLSSGSALAVSTIDRDRSERRRPRLIPSGRIPSVIACPDSIGEHSPNETDAGRVSAGMKRGVIAGEPHYSVRAGSCKE